MLYRAGPGGYEIDTLKHGTFSVSHWFDGWSQVHRFVLKPSADGSHVTEVTYNSRHTCDEMIEIVRKTGEIGKITFGQKFDPCQSYFKKVMTSFHAFNSTDATTPTNANVGVTLSADLPFADQTVKKDGKKTTAESMKTLWTKTDIAMYQQLDPATLEPLQVAKSAALDPALKGGFSAAHSRFDPVTGDWYNFNLDLGKNCTYRIFRVSAKTGKAKILATLSGPDIKPAYIHSFIMTEHYVVLDVYAGHLQKSGLAVVWYKNMLDALQFEPDKKNLWFVVDRHGENGVVGVYQSDPFFSFHPCNAWEIPSETEPGKVDIIADAPVFPNIDVIKRFYYDNMKSTSPNALAYVGEHKSRDRPSLTRFRLVGVGDQTVPVMSKRREVETVWKASLENSVELPTFDPRLATKPSRYIYGVSDRGNSTFLDGLLKFDSNDQSSKAWLQHGQSPGEPIFIPNPEGTDEDDGVCLSVVLDGPKGTSYLLVLDAKTFTELGRASLESAVGFGFHGTHIGI